MSASEYHVVLKKEEHGFTVLVPDLPGCVTFGETLEGAKEMANEAIELYLESTNDHDEKAPR